MHRAHLTSAAAAGAVVVLAASTAAVAVGTPTPEAPPRIAFVANAFNPADALAVGPIAGQLGAPLCTTAADALSAGAADCLTGYGPELVLVAGGPGAIADGVLDQIRTTTGLQDDAVDRVFGTGRTETAAALAQVFADRGINPAFLPVDAMATDADLLDGLDSTAFQPAGDYLEVDDTIDADTLGGATADDFHQGELTWAYSPNSFDLEFIQPGTLASFAGIAVLDPSSTDDTSMLLPLDRPVDDGGPAAGSAFGQLLELAVCYAVDDAADAITGIELLLQDLGSEPFGTASAFQDTVSLSSTTRTCADIALPAGGVSLPGPATLRVVYSPTDTGASHQLLLTGVTATWGPTG